MKKLKIVSISSELAPFSKSGGLGDVARSLPKAIHNLGHQVICITPLYGQIIDKEEHGLKLIYENVDLRLNSQDVVKVNYWKGYLKKDLPVYFVENKQYFSRKQKPYQSGHENVRFLIFNVAALKLISLMKFEANIIHCHDWQTGLIPFYLKTDFRYSKTLKKAKTVFTIHNLIFQMGTDWWKIPPGKKDYGRKKIPHITDPKIEYINFAKRAILSADIINTVSEKYRDELMTKKFGQDLHRVLINRQDRLFGILNGIDHKAYNPINDPGLYKNYSADNFYYKKENKKYLQEKFGLTVNENTPLICTTSRVTFQKGFMLILKMLPPLIQMNLQMIIIGSGDKEYIKKIKQLARKHPQKLAVLPSHEENQKYETLVYAASDFFLLPSHYEPCGINQLIAMRYGCVPIVRKVGGLHDTVQNYNPLTNTGTGFSFTRFNSFILFGAIVRGLEDFWHKNKWNQLVQRVMRQSHGWELPAKKYIKLYRIAMRMNGKGGKQ